MDETSIGGPKKPLSSTNWGVVQQASQPFSPHYQQALDFLSRKYWKPVYIYLRRSGHPNEDAKDLAQGFFESCLRRKTFGKADASKGRFRTFLLSALRNYLSDERDRREAQKRGGGWKTMTMAEAEASAPSTGGAPESPEQAFHRQWAMTILEGALQEMRTDFLGDGQEIRFALFERYLYTIMQGNAPNYSELSQDSGLSVTDVTNYLHRARSAFREKVLGRIREDVEDPKEVEEELHDLFRFLG